MSSTGFRGAGAQPAKATIADLERMGAESVAPELFCVKLAQVLRVRRDEVALLRVEKNCLRFVFPTELRAAGLLPLSGSAVAARTASTRSPLLSNSFARVKHVSLFETVKIGDKDAGAPGSQQLPIQKIMSVPVIASGRRVVGVVQVSRKGLDPKLAGDDFTNDDLKLLEQAAQILAGLPFMQEVSEL
jgi:GAF domain-containing protein